MSKTRVYEVARELGVPNRELIQRIASMGIQVRNHMSVLEPAEVDRVKRAFDKDKSAQLVEERIRPTVVRRRNVSRRGKAGGEEAATAEQAAGAEQAAAGAEGQQAGQAAARASGAQARDAASSQAGAPQSEPARARGGGAEPQPAGQPSSEARTPRRPRKTGQAAEPSSAQPARAEAPSGKESRVAEPEEARGAGTSREQALARGGEPEAGRTSAPARGGETAAEEPGGAPAAQAKETSEAAGGAQEAGEAASAEEQRESPSQPPPASSRLSRSSLPPGVVARGKQVAPGNQPLTEDARNRIVSEHQQQQQQRRPEAPRRRELGRRDLGPTGRPAGRGGRPGKKKMAPGKKGKQTEITTPSAQKRVIRIEEQIQLQTLAQRMSMKATDVLMKLMKLGMSGVHINSSLDVETANILASEFGYEVENVARSEEEIVGDARGPFEDKQTDRVSRAPVITVMGHVDHGKTSLLDRIRKADVVAGEAGGITQHIGAYRVESDRGPAVFLDTPGHEAFTAMRSRGAQATDIVVLVVAADDGVKPQTKEAINHAKAANVPLVVALNKVDKHDAQQDKVKTELAAEGLQPEEWGGETLYVPCSAVSGQGISELLENIVLQAELLELKGNPEIPAEGVVLEAYLDRGRGPVANVLVRDGTVSTGDYVVAGSAWGRVRAMSDDRGKQTKSAGPSTPVEILGLSEVPSAGDLLYKVRDQKKAEEVAEARRKPSDKTAAPAAARGLEQLQQLMQSGEVQELKLVLKADVQGSVEALHKALGDLGTEKVKVNVIHTGVGGITENDIMLASASNAIIVGFNVRPQGQARSTAKKEGVDLRTYNVIYEAIDDVKKAMAGMLEPKIVEKDLGKAEVRQTFNIPRVGTVAGCYVTEGKVTRNGWMRVVRDGIQQWQGQVGSLKRFTEDVREVSFGYECGIGLQGFNDIKVGDVLECFEKQEVAPEL